MQNVAWATTSVIQIVSPPRNAGEHVVQRDARDDARQGDRQDHEQRDGLAAEELVAAQREWASRVPSSKAMSVATMASPDRASPGPRGRLVVDRLPATTRGEAAGGGQVRLRRR